MIFAQPAKKDIDYALSLLMHEARRQVLDEKNRITSEAIKHGALHGNRVIVTVADEADKIHKASMAQAAQILIDFVKRMGRPATEITAWARPHLENLSSAVLGVIPPNGFPQDHQSIVGQYQAVFRQRVDGTLREVEIGFIGGRAVMKESEKSQSKAWRLLKGIYDLTRASSEPVFVSQLGPSVGLTEVESQAAWRYLRDSGLIETFSIQGTARINAAGVNAIEGASRHPDQPIIGFPSVTYNIVNNTTSIGTAVNSPVQQAGQGSTQKGRFVGRVSTRDSAEHIREAVRRDNLREKTRQSG